MRTYQQTTAEATHDWYIVDAAGQRLGTLAVKIARRSPAAKADLDAAHRCGDFVVVINAERVELGGDKWNQKVYHRHSGYPGGLRTETAAQVLAKHPERLIERAVRGMLATNRMRDVQLGRLNVYVGTPTARGAKARGVSVRHADF